MEAQLNKYRQYTISDYLINTNKFMKYLNFCLEHNLKNEKKYLMDILLRNLQLKENCGKPRLLTELRKLCTLIIIFSDFEIELLFQMNYLIFNPEIQKRIFLEVKDYLNNNNNHEIINEEKKIYITNKYHFWMLKLANQNFSSINEIKDTILVEKELKDSINILVQFINDINNNEIYDSRKENEQLFIIKILYELGLYFFYKDEEKNSFKFLNLLITYYNKYIQKYKADVNNDDNNVFYFDIKNVKALIKYYENKKNKKENNMIIERSENNINNINILNNEDIINCENILNEDFNKYKDEINKTENDFKNLIQTSNSNSLNEIDCNSKNCIKEFLSCLKIAEFSTYNVSENFSYYKITNDYINTIQNKLDNKISSNTNRKDDADLQYIKKEIVYLINLLDIINKVNNNKEKLDKSFLQNLAKYIMANTLTDNLRLSGMLHSYIINFNHNIKRTSSYFSKFVEFFEDKTSIYKDETIKQIIFLDKIVKIFHEINDTKNKLSFPLSKEIIVNFQEEFYIELIKIFLYWLTPKEDSKESENINGKSHKKVLKYSHSSNILFILIESLKNWEFLKMLKNIYSIILKFIIDIKYLNNLEFNSNLVEALYETKPKLFKVNALFDNVIRGFVAIVDDISYYINIKINFEEIKNINEININKENINFYIEILFNLVRSIENKLKIIEHSSLINIDKNINDIINYNKEQFLFSFFHSREISQINNSKNNEIKKAIVNGINYFRYVMNNYKINYMKLDLMSDNIKLKKNYETFKSLIDQDILYQLILCFFQEKRILESIILIQYSKKYDKNIAFILLKNLVENNDSINFNNFKFIWKIPLFEYLANYYSKNNNNEAINTINVLIKRISNHQFFKGHQIRKNFKIINFLNFLEYLNNNKYNL